MRARLLSWQWDLYPAGHRDRRNLTVHILTVPFFMLGTCAAIAGPFLSLWLVPGGIAAMGIVMALQGQTHRLERKPPVPFQGASDVLSRIFAEQWITFPRFVLTGEFANAWRASKAKPGTAAMKLS